MSYLFTGTSIEQKIAAARSLVHEQIARCPCGRDLRDQQLPGRRHGRGAPGAGSHRRRAGDLSRYRLPLRGDLRLSRSPDRSEWGLNLVNVLPAAHRGRTGVAIRHPNQTAPDRCCGMRKVGPLFASLEPYRLWFTGLRREQAKTRPTFKLSTPLPCPRASNYRKSARWPTGRPATYGNTPDNTASRCYRSTKRATPASAASHAPACRSIPMIPAPAAGVDASRNVVSTCNRSKREFPCWSWR